MDDKSDAKKKVIDGCVFVSMSTCERVRRVMERVRERGVARGDRGFFKLGFKLCVRIFWKPFQTFVSKPFSSLSLPPLFLLPPKKAVHFDEVLRVVRVPSWRILRPGVCASLWTSSSELKAAKKRSVVEFEFEEFEFEKVVDKNNTCRKVKNFKNN